MGWKEGGRGLGVGESDWGICLVFIDIEVKINPKRLTSVTISCI
jgi:hypothetical protein